VRLSTLAALASGEVFGPNLTVNGMAVASDQVQAGDLFAAVAGQHVHGAAYAAAALAHGAAAVLTDPAGLAQLPSGTAAIVVADARAAVAPVAAAVYGDPSSRLAVLGITGTSGKTTTSYLVRAGLSAAGAVSGLIGTVATWIGDDELPAGFTTPEAPDLQALLAVMAERGASAVVMEVSSHALALGRANAVDFAVAAFTNLSQDHLDFHPDMESYFQAKAMLFGPGMARRAVIDVTDPWGARLAREIAGVPVLEVGPDVGVSTGLLGEFNRRNAAVAVAVLEALGVPDALASVAAVAGVPGRMEVVDAGQDFLALVDYAHTPEAVATLLDAVRPITSGRITVVIGCGGDRDRGKRPLMGRAAAERADRVVLTDDNPRSESSEEILAAMLDGVPATVRDRVVVCADRHAAIELAVAPARAGDSVVIAGKGHEAGQEIAGVVHPFDDRVVLREALQRRMSRGSE
jgi:UDP-N-acetylmuramoyl-L-alanyl-D-glutamate--2,6-diaminopimelate ligase